MILLFKEKYIEEIINQGQFRYDKLTDCFIHNENKTIKYSVDDAFDYSLKNIDLSIVKSGCYKNLLN